MLVFGVQQSDSFVHTYIHIYKYIYIFIFRFFCYGLLYNIDYHFLCCTVGPCCSQYLSLDSHPTFGFLKGLHKGNEWETILMSPCFTNLPSPTTASSWRGASWVLVGLAERSDGLCFMNSFAESFGFYIHCTFLLSLCLCLVLLSRQPFYRSSLPVWFLTWTTPQIPTAHMFLVKPTESSGRPSPREVIASLFSPSQE